MVKVKLSMHATRPIQLRYKCPATGRDVRISTGTRDVTEAERQRARLEAELLLGIQRRKDDRTKIVGPRMPWEEFREVYYERHLRTLRKNSIRDADSAFDILEKILKPNVLADVADREALQRLQSKLLEGASSRFERARSPHTVRSRMAVVKAALNWAHEQGWLDTVPAVRKVRTSKLKAAKGRPITAEEFERMLAKVAAEVGEVAAESWKYTLRGLWESALRLDELMHVSWDDARYIMPVWGRGRLPVLQIPASMQKNDTEEAIPLLPWFEKLLLETPKDKRTGWAFNPQSTQTKHGRPIRFPRASTDWVSKVIVRVGKAAKVVVDPGDDRTGRPIKYASAHDLRRSCAERLLAANVPQTIIGRVLRHASWETTRRHYAVGDVQREAGVLRELLGTTVGTHSPSQEVHST